MSACGLILRRVALVPAACRVAQLLDAAAFLARYDAVEAKPVEAAVAVFTAAHAPSSSGLTLSPTSPWAHPDTRYIAATPATPRARVGIEETPAAASAAADATDAAAPERLSLSDVQRRTVPSPLVWETLELTHTPPPRGDTLAPPGQSAAVRKKQSALALRTPAVQWEVTHSPLRTGLVTPHDARQIYRYNFSTCLCILLHLQYVPSALPLHSRENDA